MTQIKTGPSFAEAAGFRLSLFALSSLLVYHKALRTHDVRGLEDAKDTSTWILYTGKSLSGFRKPV